MLSRPCRIQVNELEGYIQPISLELAVTASNQVKPVFRLHFFYYILELKQCHRCQVFLKYIQHLSLGRLILSPKSCHFFGKNRFFSKRIFISKFFTHDIQCILKFEKKG